MKGADLVTVPCQFYTAISGTCPRGREEATKGASVDVVKRRSGVIQTRSLVGKGAIKKSTNVLYNRHAQYYKLGD